MALLDFLNRGKKEDAPAVAAVLPKDIYGQTNLFALATGKNR